MPDGRGDLQVDAERCRPRSIDLADEVERLRAPVQVVGQAAEVDQGPRGVGVLAAGAAVDRRACSSRIAASVSPAQ